MSFDKLIEKYQLNDFQSVLNLRKEEKVDFFNELESLMKSMIKIIDKLSNIASLRGAQVLLSLSKLYEKETVINKTDVQKCLNIDRREKLYHAFDYLEEQNYIQIEEKNSKFHILKLNEEDVPELGLLKELVQKYWTSPREEKKIAQSWSEKSE